jgi:hypothetical protein
VRMKVGKPPRGDSADSERRQGAASNQAFKHLQFCRINQFTSRWIFDLILDIFIYTYLWPYPNHHHHHHQISTATRQQHAGTVTQWAAARHQGWGGGGRAHLQDSTEMSWPYGHGVVLAMVGCQLEPYPGRLWWHPSGGAWDAVPESMVEYISPKFSTGSAARDTGQPDGDFALCCRLQLFQAEKANRLFSTWAGSLRG